MRVKATKEGWDGRQIRKPGEIFDFDGPKGLWMVEVDASGNPAKGEKVPSPERPVRAGASQTKGKSRDDLRKECKALGIKFPATAGAAELGVLIQKHHEAAEGGASASGPNASDTAEGGAPDVEPDGNKEGTGNQEVL